MKPTFSVEETASILKVSPRTVIRYIRSGILKASKPGRTYVILEESLEKMLYENEYLVVSKSKIRI